MSLFSIIFLLALVAGTLLQWWLTHRQIGSVRRHRGQVPAAFSSKIELSEHQKAADYTTAKTRFGQWMLLFEVVVLLLWTFGGLLQMLDQSWRALGWSELWTGVAFMVSFAVLNSLIELPVGIYRTFRLEAGFGFNRTTPKLFVVDLIKSFLLSLVIGVPLLTLVLWIMASLGEIWWLVVWAVLIGFNLLMMWAYPAFIAPLFNKFQPLDNPELRERIENLLQRNGFTSNGVFVMDGSRRSGHGNAYFTGLGHNKRIVFFDTLLEHLQPAEVEAVLAHEVGHFKHKHIHKRFFMIAGVTLAALALLGWLMQQAWFFHGLGVSEASTYMALVLFSLGMPVFGIFFSPLPALLSRRHEFEADAFASAQANAEILIQALVKLYRENAGTLTPDPMYSAFYDSHPPAPVRVAYLHKISTAAR